MAWITPKTDWYGAEDSTGVYTGDRFNDYDFNRIKNNLKHLRDTAVNIYDEFTIKDMGADKTPNDYLYADEMNLLFDNLNTININTFNTNYGETPVYEDNGSTMTFEELNMLESAMLDIYQKLINLIEGRRMFTWNFGVKGGL